MEESNYYIYCISLKEPGCDTGTIAGHHNQTVFHLEYKELAVYISKTFLTHYEANYDNLKCHEDVIAQLMNYVDVLPMSFSTICKSEDQVLEMLAKYYDQFIDNLKKISDKVEMGIKVFYRFDFEVEDRKDMELIMQPKEYMKKRFERYIDRQKKVDEILYDIEDNHMILAGIANESSFTKPLKNNLIFNASYLVMKSKMKAFDKAVDEMIKRNPAYKIIYSGPWPAYHFVSIVREGEEDG